MRANVARALLCACTLLLLAAAPTALANSFGGPDSVHDGRGNYVDRRAARSLRLGDYTVTVKPRLSRAQTKAVARRVVTRSAARSAAIEAVKRAPIVSGSTDSNGLPRPLMDAVREVQAACPGFRVISGYRPGDTWGLHAVAKAVDIAGPDYDCAYRVLRKFPGGISTDAWNPRIAHIHLSWAPNGPEWGRKFPHPEFQGGIRHGPKAAEWKRRFDAAIAPRLEATLGAE